MVQLFGRLTRDAFTSETKSGKSVINFTIALNDDYKNKEGEKIKRTAYIHCAYWVNKTNILKYLTKGRTVEVFVCLFPSTYTNKQGETIPAINATVEKLKFHGGSGNDNKDTSEQTNAASAAVKPVDDLPF